MNYEEIDKIAELEGFSRELKSQNSTYRQALQRIQMGDDVVSSEIARNALIMGDM